MTDINTLRQGYKTLAEGNTSLGNPLKYRVYANSMFGTEKAKQLAEGSLREVNMDVLKRKLNKEYSNIDVNQLVSDKQR